MSLNPKNDKSNCSASPQTQVLKPISGETPRPSLVAPLIQSTTYVQESLPAEPGHTYSRVSNPTVSELEEVLGRLENAPPAVCFSTGIAAELALFLTLLKSGDHVLAGQAIYGGTVRLLNDLLTRFGVEVSFVDASDAEKVKQAIRPNTRLVFIETPANPTLELTDIRAIVDVAHAHNAYVAVDNTFLTAVLQQPLELGADFSVYSTTKHIEGHSAALGGAIVCRDEGLLERLRWTRKTSGTIQTPFNAWLTRQGLKTCPLRIRQHSQNALEFAQWLEQCRDVASVYYPGLESNPNISLAQRQHLGGHGGVLAFELVGGYEAAQRFLPHLKLGRLCEHVGTVETLYTHPASMTHADVPHSQLAQAGITPGMIRISVGLEEVAEIIADFEQAVRLMQNSNQQVGESIRSGSLC
ncbi:MAG: aminotransferase class I/II-fold pyridoxal phosphate-dependent enzyme [Pirellulaceae bacterium]